MTNSTSSSGSDTIPMHYIIIIIVSCIVFIAIVIAVICWIYSKKTRDNQAQSRDVEQFSNLSISDYVRNKIASAAKPISSNKNEKVLFDFSVAIDDISKSKNDISKIHKESFHKSLTSTDLSTPPSIKPESNGKTKENKDFHLKVSSTKSDVNHTKN